MKSLEQIKKELHEYIDGISEQKELMVIYENTLEHLRSASRIDEKYENGRITDSQQKGSDDTLNHASSDVNKRVKETKRSTARWFNDGGQNAC